MAHRELRADAKPRRSQAQVKTELLPDGSANVTFEFNLENFGNVDLSGISLVDDLSATFGTPCEVSVMSLTSDDFIVNAAYDGHQLMNF